MEAAAAERLITHAEAAMRDAKHTAGQVAVQRKRKLPELADPHDIRRRLAVPGLAESLVNYSAREPLFPALQGLCHVPAAAASGFRRPFAGGEMSTPLLTCIHCKIWCFQVD